MSVRHFMLMLALGLMLSPVLALPIAPPPGKTQFEFVDQKGDPTRPVKVWMFVPDGCDKNCPLQFVMHGDKRNGEDYLGHWVEFAKARKFIAVAPEFTRKFFPRDDDYSLGRSTVEADPAKWGLAVPEHLFDELKARYGFTADTYRMFGHSAGGQFVHRMHLFVANHRADPIIAANPGWYTVPEWGMGKTAFKFPYTTIGSRVDAARAKEALGCPFVLMLGSKDIDPNDPVLNKSAGAREQGSYRFARGEYFYNASINAAKALGVNFAWQKKTVDGVAHSGPRMSAAAVELMMDPRFAASLGRPCGKIPKQ
ncbi:MAG: hypothetical protein LH481_03695 [Burkholderiales bacterium]|nr:hypothetical protein [Burkholderiales bacterium]